MSRLAIPNLIFFLQLLISTDNNLFRRLKNFNVLVSGLINVLLTATKIENNTIITMRYISAFMQLQIY